MSVIDLEHLHMMTSGDAALAIEVLGIFRSQSDMWGRLLDADAPQDQWADACHTIKGAARSIGAHELGETCERGERMGRGRPVSRAQAALMLGEVKDRLADVREALARTEHQLSMKGSFAKAWENRA